MFQKISAKAIIIQIITSVVCIAVACIPGIYLAHFGAQGFDEPYQMLNALDYKNVPFAPLSNVFGSIFGSIMGYEWLTFRYLGLGLYWLSILMGCVYFWCKTGKFKLFLLCSTLLILIANVYRLCHVTYGWDSWTLPLLVATIILTLEYISSKRTWQLIALGLLSAVISWCRVPDAIVVPMLCAIVFYFNDKSTRTRATTIYAVTALVAIVALLIAMYGTPGNYLSYVAANSIDEHDFHAVVFGHINSVARNLPYVATILLTYFVISKWRKLWIFAVVLCYTLCYSMLYQITPFLASVLDVELAIALVIIGAAFYFNRNTTDGKKIVAISLLALVPITLSNTGIYKIIALPMIPIALIYLYQHINRPMKIVGVACFASLFLFVPYGTCRHHTYNDVGTNSTTYTYSSGLAKGLRTSPAAGRYVDMVMASVEPYRATHKIIVLRNEADYIYEYLLQSRNSFMRHRFNGCDTNAPEYVEWVENQLNGSGEQPVAVLYFGKPSEMTYMLGKYCSREVCTPTYSLYITE